MTAADSGGSREEAALLWLRRVFACSPDLAAAIRARGRLRDYRPRSFLVRHGDAISVLFVMISGLAHAIAYSSEGQAVLLHEYGTGDVFGASGSLQPVHEADVVAVTEVLSFLLDGGELALLAERHGRIALALLKLLVDRLQRTETRMYEHAALSSVGRVHAELLRLARQSPAMTIRPAPVISDLALRVSTSRETASRAISALERRGIVSRTGDALRIVAPERLEELVV